MIFQTDDTVTIHVVFILILNLISLYFCKSHVMINDSKLVKTYMHYAHFVLGPGTRTGATLQAATLSVST
jgi:hypothetical protein